MQPKDEIPQGSNKKKKIQDFPEGFARRVSSISLILPQVFAGHNPDKARAEPATRRSRGRDKRSKGLGEYGLFFPPSFLVAIAPECSGFNVPSHPSTNFDLKWAPASKSRQTPGVRAANTTKHSEDRANLSRLRLHPASSFRTSLCPATHASL